MFSRGIAEDLSASVAGRANPLSRFWKACADSKDQARGGGSSHHRPYFEFFNRRANFRHVKKALPMPEPDIWNFSKPHPIADCSHRRAEFLRELFNVHQLIFVHTNMRLLVSRPVLRGVEH